MAESPFGWDLLTSSLAVSDLENEANKAWAFLVIQGLVHDRPGDRDRFFEIVRRTLEQGPITGPTVARRVAIGIRGAGLTVRSEDPPDPMAKIAQARLDTIRAFESAAPPERAS
jgi:hypothetical protein